ncbi:acetylornithine/N-succinyldiaminopimelate aminotransferase [Rhodobium orientis]|uniref:Acetylornithine aminotransferase n=1 Tax=Rhodobium orientis TaxID=34017 RepID=A0A327JNC7_9HYPH|nr:aspartate aminotransferase family protein [Rhodobium orientis]MBB4304917.1 acetylornithine/N-succinyldiaminopimelate aminotransferase [Rhodobium orientis]MBK5951236.1 acetylornithine transaminase [Rhodobium orientis]RAI27076.1 acetylornithine transaminase [Rhodobium orientis]
MSNTSLYPTYARADLTFERGEGVWLESSDGTRYLDFAAGIAVNGLGHAHPHLVATLTGQAEKLWHVSNVFRIPDQERLAERLCAASFADRVFFTNSGSEAIEGAIKTARRYHFVTGNPERYRLITFEGAFHGRTLGAIAAGGQAKYLEGFGPRVEGFDQVPFGDIEALKAAIGPETAGVLIEPIQGEGGIRPLPHGDLKRIREICDDNGILLVLDEVQCGIGRTGRLFAHEWAGIEPDILAAAKGIGGGFPVGACMATEEAAKGMTTGTHGSTYGGNPLAMAVANAVLDVVLEPGFIERVSRLGLTLKQKLAGLVDSHPEVFETIRGEGLMLGIKCRVAPADVVAAARDHQLLTVGAGDNVLRLLPPLIVTEQEIDEAIGRLDAAATEIETRIAENRKGAAE